MAERAISPVLGTVLLVGLVLILSAVGFAMFQTMADDPGGAPTVDLRTTDLNVDGCSLTYVVADGSHGGLVFYRAGDQRVLIDDDGNGKTDAGETVRLPPRNAVTFLANDSEQIYEVDQFDGGNGDCLTAAGREKPGARTTHGIRYDVEYYSGSGTVGNSLNEISISYESGSGADASGVTADDVVAVGFDRDDDPDIDVSVGGDLQSVSASNGGRTLELGFTGNYNVKRDDEIIVRYDAVKNPTAAGTYTTSVNVNGDVTQSGKIRVR
ncbi:type IV pilin [Halorientalis sp.]|uniref:type IV pilin n=1 Tax=Halorientalis sp. TaxID=1931229 RepID=UPI002636D482|nr:type IV pilin [Halorientalis sp.]